MKNLYTSTILGLTMALSCLFGLGQEGNPFTISLINQNTSVHCQSGPVEIGAIVHGQPEGFTFEWDGGETTPTIFVQPKETTHYSLTVKNVQTHYTNTFVFHVNFENPKVIISSTDAFVSKKICPGTSQKLEASAEGGVPPYTYTWSNGMQGREIEIITENSFELTVQASDACGTKAEAVSKVEVEPHDPLLVPSDKIIEFDCSDEKISLSPELKEVSGGVGHGFTYSFTGWEGENHPISVKPVDGGKYQVQFTDACRNTFKSSSIILKKKPVVPPPVKDLEVCKGNNVDILKGTAPGYGYVNAGSDYQGSYLEEAEKTKTYVLYYLDGCGDTHPVERKVYVRSVEAAFDHEILPDGRIGIRNYTDGSGIHYEWEVNGKTYQDTEPTLALEYGKTHQVSLKATDELGCSCNVTREIDLTDQITVPNAFSPDGDGLNDLFSIASAQPLAQFEIKIFDRWGQLVYQSNDFMFEWNGMDPNGKETEMGTYIYQIKATTMAGDSYSKDGSISVFYTK